MGLKIASGPLTLGRGGGLQIKASSFTPLSLSPVAWFKADTGLLDASDAVISADATAIKTWQDQSGNANHLTQTTAGSRPLAKNAIQNGKRVVRFDGTDDSIGAVTLPLNQPSTWIAVGCFRTAYSSNQTFFDTTGASNRALLSRRSSTDMGIYAGTGVVSGATTPQAWHVYSCVFNGASSQIWVDGVSLATGNAGTQNASGLRIAVNQGSLEVAALDAGELLLFNGALSAANRQALEAYAKARWASP